MDTIKGWSTVLEHKEFEFVDKLKRKIVMVFYEEKIGSDTFLRLEIFVPPGDFYVVPVFASALILCDGCYFISEFNIDLGSLPRRKGIGTKILEIVDDFANEHNIAFQIGQLSNVDKARFLELVAFYKKNGYTVKFFNENHGVVFKVNRQISQLSKMQMAEFKKRTTRI